MYFFLKVAIAVNKNNIFFNLKAKKSLTTMLQGLEMLGKLWDLNLLSLRSLR